MRALLCIAGTQKVERACVCCGRIWSSSRGVHWYAAAGERANVNQLCAQPFKCTRYVANSTAQGTASTLSWLLRLKGVSNIGSDGRIEILQFTARKTDIWWGAMQ